MGSYSTLVINGYPMCDCKNNYYSDIVTSIFQPEDFFEEKRKYSSRNPIYWGDTYVNEKGSYTFKGFKQKADICLQRLEIKGYNLTSIKPLFTKAKKIALFEINYSIDFPLSKISFEQFCSEIKTILDSKEKPYEMLRPYKSLREALIDMDFMFPGLPFDAILYLVLKSVPSESIVEYDLTDILNGGWVKKSEVISFETQKTLILTEGKTDVDFISSSMQKLYPHLVPYYQFIDFGEYKIESNASALVKLIISFSAAKVEHPMIAIFDNDTTGLMEMGKLKHVKLASNIRVMRLPDIQVVKKYSTIGPTGRRKMNINGYACSIELYFGMDCLIDDTGEQIPVHWKAYNEKEKKYQGEISEKGNVQDKFREKLKSKDEKDFSDMDAVLKSIFNAFQNVRKKE
jgi:hypothetical protein